MAFLEKRGLIAAKIESVEGTDPMTVPGTADATSHIIAINPLSPEVEAETIERDVILTHLSSIGNIVGIRTKRVTFATEVAGRGAIPTAATPLRVDPLLRMCGLSATYSAGTSVRYTPISDGFESSTIYANLDGILAILRGCRGTFNVDLTTGQYGKFNWNAAGFYDALTNGAPTTGGIRDQALPAGTYDAFSLKPPAVLGVTTVIHGAAAGAKIMQAMTLDMNNDLQRQDDMNQANGAFSFMINGRRIQGTINPVAVTRATFDYWERWQNAVEGEISVQVGSTAGNRVKFSMLAAQFGTPRWATRNGKRVYEIPWTANAQTSGGNDEFMIEFS